ncbi:MAG: TetR/AcrR family transcriptional regulator [Deltaproteobacteria bacterium]|jgi:AcrR family transcriptional regulator|nr:TetR/AcrR family transcriptional regulator [Deltaproteobacteria bacterium]
MPRHPSTKTVGRPLKNNHDDNSRTKILEAAINVFSQRGITASTIKEIGYQAEVTPAMVYYHFHNKGTLIRESLDHHLMPLVKHWWEPGGQDLDPLAMIMEMVKRFLSSFNSKPWFLPLWSRELASDGGNLRTYLAARLDSEQINKFRANIVRGQKEGSINSDLLPEMVFISLISNVCLPLLAKHDWELIWKTPIDSLVLENHIWAMVRNGLTPITGRRIDEPQQREPYRDQPKCQPRPGASFKTRAASRKRRPKIHF